MAVQGLDREKELDPSQREVAEFIARQEEIERREALEAQRQEQRRGQMQAVQGAVKAQAQQALKQAGKQAAKKAATRIAASGAVSAIGSALSAIGAFLAPALPIILIVAVVIFLVIVSAYVICNPTEVLGTALGTAVKIYNYLFPVIPDAVCEVMSGIGSAAVGLVEKGVTLMCSTPEVVAQQTGARWPTGNDEKLDDLIRCVEGRAAAQGFSVGSKFTYEEDNRFCNASRGDNEYEDSCGRCAHAENSCHYGGATGQTGSLAVDFGGNPDAGNEGVVGPKILQAVQACSQQLGITLKRSVCEALVTTQQNGDNWVLCSDSRAHHVHTSIVPCDGDNGPINSN